MVNDQTGDITGVVAQNGSAYIIETSMYRMFITRLKKPLEQVVLQLTPYKGHHFEIHEVAINPNA